MTAGWRSLLTSIELRHLRFFIAAAEHGSFRKAGAALGVRESSISRGIRDLEAHLGASLFRRQLGGASLNPAGLRFLQRAQIAMTHLHHGARDARAIGRNEKGHIRIGVLSSMASGFLSELVRAFGILHSGVQIDIIEGRQVDHITAVRQHQIDAAFIADIGEHRECGTIHLWSEQIFAAIPNSHDLAKQETLAWSDFAGELLLISEQASDFDNEDHSFKYFGGVNGHPDIIRQNVGRDNLMSLVAIGRGLALTSEAMTAVCFPGVVYRPVAGETLPFSAVWSPKNDNPALRRLLNMARARREAIKPLELSMIPPYPPSNVELS